MGAIGEKQGKRSAAMVSREDRAYLGVSHVCISVIYSFVCVYLNMLVPVYMFVNVTDL